MEHKNIYVERNEFKKKQDLALKIIRLNRRKKYLFFIIATLSLISLLNLNSVSFYNQGMKNTLVMKHGIFLFVSFLTMLVVGRINYKIYDRNRVNLFLLLLCILVLGGMPFVAQMFPTLIPKVNGGIRWIRLPGGISLQPAEFFKICFVVLLAHQMAISEKNHDTGGKLILNNLAIPAIFAILVMMQKDLGTTLHYMAIFLYMFFMSKISGRLVASIGVLLATLIAGFLGYVFMFQIEGGYRIGRIKSYLDGLIYNQYDNDKGYQVSQSLIGFGNGGFWGTGYGNGVQKYSYLPEIHTDFIISSIGEEFGFLGMCIILLLFVGLFNQIKSTASDCEDYFGKYLSVGIAGMIFIQFLINVSVAIGNFPVSGLPLPILSYGGTSLLATFIAFGIIFNINSEKLKSARALRDELNQS